MNLCRGCNQDFASIEAFDAHRVGVHAYTYSQGLQQDPMVEDGRRCIPTAELEAGGFRRNARGQWEQAARSDRTRAIFDQRRRAAA